MRSSCLTHRGGVPLLIHFPSASPRSRILNHKSLSLLLKRAFFGLRLLPFPCSCARALRPLVFPAFSLILVSSLLVSSRFVSSRRALSSLCSARVLRLYRVLLHALASSFEHSIRFLCDLRLPASCPLRVRTCLQQHLID